jgi:hypothetical protein
MHARSPFVVLVTIAVSSCGGAQSAGGSPGSPERPPGCAIEVVHEGVPTRPTRRLGEVVARCRGAFAHDEARCMRQLEDQACHMGGSVVWDLRSAPIPGEGDEGTEMRAETAVYRE